MKKASLILFRHGNTFEAGQTPVWVGARTDLALTADGEKQALAAAAYVEQRFDPVVEIVAGPLLRTCRFAEIIANQARQPFRVDERLREIDYGLWEGLDSVAIRQKYGTEPLEQWEKFGDWPKAMQWKPSLEELNAALADFLREQNRKLVDTMMDSPEGAYNIAVTSNGILRLIYTLVTGKPCEQANKVKTGHACVLAPDGEGWHVMAWNENPAKAKLQPL